MSKPFDTAEVLHQNRLCKKILERLSDETRATGEYAQIVACLDRERDALERGDIDRARHIVKIESRA